MKILSRRSSKLYCYTVPKGCDPREEVPEGLQKEELFRGSEVAASEPTVSVIIAAYNVSEFIGETVESVFAQTFRAYEVIVVNDGSEDRSELERVLEPYRERIIYITQENQGLAASRNRGLREARGEYAAFLDADDVWLPTYLEEQLDFIRRGDYDLVYSDALLFGDSPLAGQTFMETAPSRGPVTFESLVSAECNVIGSGVVARRRKLFDAGLFDKGLRNSQDFDLWIRMVRMGARMAYQRKVLLKYRYREGSLSGDAANRIARELRVLDKIETAYDLTPGERAQVSRAKDRIRATMELENGKRHLARGEFAEARACFSKANRSLKSWKLGAALLSLRIAPRLFMKVAKSRLPQDV